VALEEFITQIQTVSLEVLVEEAELIPVPAVQEHQVKEMQVEMDHNTMMVVAAEAEAAVRVVPVEMQ
jgi:hypothetical protein